MMYVRITASEEPNVRKENPNETRAFSFGLMTSSMTLLKKRLSPEKATVAIENTCNTVYGVPLQFPRLWFGSI